MHRKSWKSLSSPRIAGVQWASTVESTLWGMAPGVVIVVGVPSSRRGVVTFRGSCRPGSRPGQGQSQFRGSCPCHSRVPRRGKYEGGMGSW